MAKNEKLAQNLQAARQEEKQLRAVAQNTVSKQVYLKNMRTTILVKVSTLEETMQNLYVGSVTVHKEVVCFHGLQQ